MALLRKAILNLDFSDQIKKSDSYYTPELYESYNIVNIATGHVNSF